MTKKSGSGSSHERVTCKYEDLCAPFKLSRRVFDLQYFAYYNARYKKMYDWVKATAETKWGDEMKLIKLNELMEHTDERVCVIGTLLKHMTLQPSVLREVSDDLQLIPQPALKRYTEAADYAMLQDDSESVILEGALVVDEHVTGCMVAVIGKETDNGNRFVVEDYCYAELASQKPLVCTSKPKYIAIISGLGISVSEKPELASARNMFLDFVTGSLNETNSITAAQIARVIIAGNCVGKDAKAHEKELFREELEKIPDWNQQEKCYTLETIQLVDDFLAGLGKSIAVDYMPGSLDPTSAMLPQQPIHPCVLPRSSLLTSIRCVTNPYSASFDDIIFLGTSGRVVSTISEFTKYEEPVDILEKTIVWRHMVPTAPDTCSSYPFPDHDPFVLNELPHVYFAGNQEAFNTKVFQGEQGQKVRIISVPDFEATSTCVLINLQNLECELLAFG